MPNRIIKESICTSEKLAALSDFEFRVWTHLITLADDAGRGDARPAIIKGRAFPLRERVTVKDIDNAMHALAAHGCVDLYKVDGKPYYVFPRWSDHQRVRDVKPKYPSPEEASAADCGELRQIAANCGLNPIQSNTNPNPNLNTNTNTNVRRFTPPTLDDVLAYCRERKNHVNAEAFIAKYESNGWKVGGKTPMKDWKAAIRYWEQCDKERGRTYSIDEITIDDTEAI